MAKVPNETPKTGSPRLHFVSRWSSWRRQSGAIALEVARKWHKDNVSRLAAALCCYAILAIAPLGILSMAIAGAVFGQAAARGHIGAEMGAVTGPKIAQAIETIVVNARAPGSGISSTVLGVIVLIFGASGVFSELQSAMNEIWQVVPKAGQGVRTFLRHRLLSFAMVLTVALLLLASLVLSTALAALGKYLKGPLPGGELVWQVLNALTSIVLITLLFALVFRVVPDIAIEWKQVWLGAFVTSLLFTLGKLLLGLYIGKSSLASSFGAAGSLVALVIWVYYSSQIVFLGAELTEVCTRRSKRSDP